MNDTVKPAVYKRTLPAESRWRVREWYGTFFYEYKNSYFNPLMFKELLIRDLRSRKIDISDASWRRDELEIVWNGVHIRIYVRLPHDDRPQDFFVESIPKGAASILPFLDMIERFLGQFDKMDGKGADCNADYETLKRRLTPVKTLSREMHYGSNASSMATQYCDTEEIDLFNADGEKIGTLGVHRGFQNRVIDEMVAFLLEEDGSADAQ